MPKVSVIIPVYKAELYIERCVRTLFGQTLDNLEFIFVDDCSPDRSIEVMERILAEYPARKSQVKVIRHEVNQGVSSARQHGVDAATGEYIIHCDPDDWVELNMYKVLYTEAKVKHADIVICNTFINFNNSQQIRKEHYSSFQPQLLKQIIRGECHNGLWNKLIKRELFIKNAPSFMIGVDMWEDVSVLARLVYNSEKIAIVPTPLYHYYQNNINAYTQRWKSEYSESIDKAVHINLEYFKDKDVDIVPLAQRGLLYLMSNENESNRDKYLMKYCREGLMKDIDYSMYSRYSQILAYLLFNRHYKCADLLQKVKRIISKLIHGRGLSQ